MSGKKAKPTGKAQQLREKPKTKEDTAPAYHAGKNSAESYAQALGAIRLEGVKSGRFLPLPDRPHEIKASPIVERVVRIGGTSDGASGAAPHPRPSVTLYHGDCTAIVPLLAEQGPPQGWIDACVTDPPYELGFMGKGWDSSGVAQRWETWGGVRIALKPGAHLVAFAGSRTFHWIAQAIDHAGFEVRDQLMWIYGSGFPKSLDVSKAIDKTDAVGPRRERELRFTAWMRSTGITARQINALTNSNMASHYLTDKEQPAVPTREMFEKLRPHLPDVPQWVEALVEARTIESENLKRRPVVGQHEKEAHAAAWRASYDGSNVSPAGAITRAFSEHAQRWEGWGTALKPAHEPVCFARKPLSEGTVAANVLRWATGAINVDAARVGERERPKTTDPKRTSTAYGAIDSPGGKELPDARWPANVMHDGSFEVLEAFPHHAREAIRFFYAAKASKEERDFGLQGFAERARPTMGNGIGGQPDQQRANNRNIHPTVKPVDLMRYLCRLVAPAGAVILDPFMGSGSTGIAAVREGMGFIGCEQSADYFEIAHARIAAAVREAEQKAAEAPSLIDEITKATAKLRQGEMF